MSERSEAVAQDAVHDAAPAYRAVPADANQDDVPSGYKRTEVGVIPEDWGIKTLSHFISNLQAGVSVNSITSDLAGDVPCVLKTSCIQAGAFFPTEAKAISPKDRTRVRVTPKAGAILISRMNTIDLVGESGFVCADYENLFLPDRIWMTVFNRHVRFSSRWLAFVLSSPAYRRHLKEIATGTSGSMKNIAKRSLLQLTVPQPSESEQRAIATALSDADALIESLDRLIAKKRAIKQAAMQQLLTGQTRLPGFTGEWETKMLGEIAELHRRGVNPAAFPDMFFRHFSLPAFDENREPTIDLGANIGSNKFRVPQEAVLVSKLNPRIPRIWKPRSIGANAIASTEFLLLTPREGISRDFLHVVCSSTRFSEQMELSVTGTTGSHQRINPTSALKFEIMLPPSAKEQTAITTVLSDMDTEIEAIERRRDKARQIKQGMMQQLLTGRVRLIAPEKVA